MRVGNALAKPKHVHDRKYFGARIVVRGCLDPVGEKPADIWVSLVEALQRAGADEPFNLSIAQHLVKRRPFGRGRHVDIVG